MERLGLQEGEGGSFVGAAAGVGGSADLDAASSEGLAGAVDGADVGVGAGAMHQPQPQPDSASPSGSAAEPALETLLTLATAFSPFADEGCERKVLVGGLRGDDSTQHKSLHNTAWRTRFTHQVVLASLRVWC